MLSILRIVLVYVLLVSPTVLVGKSSRVDASAADLLERGITCEEAHMLSAARRNYRRVVRNYPASLEAPEALHRSCAVLLKQRRYQAAFQCFEKLFDRYPDYSGYLDAVALQFCAAEQLMHGRRNYIFGRIPGFKNRAGSIDVFKDIVEIAPYSDLAPLALMNIASIGLRLHELPIAIDALERLTDEYSTSPVAQDALLLLAKVYLDSVPGADYDQRATEMAINYCQEFLILFHDSPRVEEAESLLEKALELRAAGKVSIGNFYCDICKRVDGCRQYYIDAVRVAPKNSVAAEIAKARLSSVSKMDNGS
jgi:outer membrane protein assembly factor BamD